MSKTQRRFLPPKAGRGPRQKTSDHKPELFKDRRGEYVSIVKEVTPSERSGPLLEVRSLPLKPKYARTFSVRNSNRWIVGHDGDIETYNLPYIDKLGKITHHTMFEWKCDPRQYTATMLSTVSRRLQYYARRHNHKGVADRRAHDLVRASVYYCLTKNNWFWDRILYFTRNLQKNWRHIRTLTIKMLKKVDENKRFVYGQASLQANWLLFRVCKPRDKFTFWKDGKSWISNGNPVPPSWLKAIVKDFAQAMSVISPNIRVSP